ncbi:MAG TPA: protein-disulfide reductase DsbD domain-containing protein [Hanamia sp.]|jgi:thiol:disulfide interchange protein DsbD|nr:protein-disulfide reductase DsbD domain-containing protein [Hanamia sp.]
MKRIITISFLLLFSNILFAQIQNPVEWNATAKKIADKTYEVHLTATIDPGWHIYSQTTPEGGPIATSITFTKNPLVIVSGKTKEVGKLEQHLEPLFGNINVKQFSNKVDFVQLVKLKAPVKTSMNVAVEFEVCNDKQCLPPTTRNLSVAL